MYPDRPKTLPQGSEKVLQQVLEQVHQQWLDAYNPPDPPDDLWEKSADEALKNWARYHATKYKEHICSKQLGYLKGAYIENVTTEEECEEGLIRYFRGRGAPLEGDTVPARMTRQLLERAVAKCVQARNI